MLHNNISTSKLGKDNKCHTLELVQLKLVKVQNINQLQLDTAFKADYFS